MVVIVRPALPLRADFICAMMPCTADLHPWGLVASHLQPSPGRSMAAGFFCCCLTAPAALRYWQTGEILADYRKTVIAAVEEVNTSLVRYRSQLEAAQHLSKAVDASRRALDFHTGRYEHGISDFLNVLQRSAALHRGWRVAPVQTAAKMADFRAGTKRKTPMPNQQHPPGIAILRDAGWTRCQTCAR
jgi:hypothetical protein